MVVFNDIGLTLEIFGFILFLFVPIQESFSLGIEHKRARLIEFINKHDKIRYGLRYGGIALIIAGLVLQYSFLNLNI